MSYANENMVKIEANNNRGYLVSFVEEFTFICFDCLLFNKDRQHDEDDAYDCEYAIEQKTPQ
jgi:hypothetical protein